MQFVLFTVKTACIYVLCMWLCVGLPTIFVSLYSFRRQVSAFDNNKNSSKIYDTEKRMYAWIHFSFYRAKWKIYI